MEPLLLQAVTFFQCVYSFSLEDYRTIIAYFTWAMNHLLGNTLYSVWMQRKKVALNQKNPTHVQLTSAESEVCCPISMPLKKRYSNYFPIHLNSNAYSIRNNFSLFYCSIRKHILPQISTPYKRNITRQRNSRLEKYTKHILHLPRS